MAFALRNATGNISTALQSYEWSGEPPGMCTKRVRTKNCDSWIYSDLRLNWQLQGIVNWFLAAAQPHHPLVDAWLAQYERNLWRIDPHDKKGHPYFLHGCSLVSLHDVACVRETIHAMPTFPKGHPGSSATVCDITEDLRINLSHLMQKARFLSEAV